MSTNFDIICREFPDFINYGFRFVKDNKIVSKSNYTEEFLWARKSLSQHYQAEELLVCAGISVLVGIFNKKIR